MFPHTVSVYNSWEDDDLVTQINVTILRGVLLDMSKGTNVAKTGLVGADTATLYIPFTVQAESPDGAERSYVPPREYYAAEDKSALWTLDDGGQTNSVATYFSKGENTEALRYSEARQTLDYVFDVTAVDVRDFGGDMQHWQVSGK